MGWWDTIKQEAKTAALYVLPAGAVLGTFDWLQSKAADSVVKASNPDSTYTAPRILDYASAVVSPVIQTVRDQAATELQSVADAVTGSAADAAGSVAIPLWVKTAIVLSLIAGTVIVLKKELA